MSWMGRLAVILAASAGVHVACADDRGAAAYEAGLKAYETDPGEAISLFMTAVSEGSVEAMMAAAHCCEEGRGVPENYGFAMQWRMSAAQQDPVRAAVGMARIDSLWHGIREEDLEERRARFEQHAADIDAAYAYVNQLLSDGRQAEAEDMLERAIEKFPPDGRLLFARGVLSRSRWQVASSKIYFHAVAGLDPDSYQAGAAKAALNMDEGPRYSKVSPALKAIVAEQPEDIILRWLLAVYCRGCQKHDSESLRSYQWILERWDPGPVLVHQSYANELSERLGRHEEALPHRELAVRQADRSWSHQGLANTLFRLHRYYEAEPHYARAAELDDEDPRHFYQWGRCLNRLERFAEAEIQLRRAIKITPSVFLYHTELGFSLLGEGKYEEARVTFEQVDDSLKLDNDEMWGLAQIYRDGLGVERDAAMADEYLTRLYASKSADVGPELIPSPKKKIIYKGVSDAVMGEFFYYGKQGVKPDYRMAEKMFFTAVKRNKPIGACGLVQVYAEGGTGVQRDIPAALEWFAWLEEKCPNDYLRSPAVAEVVWIRMGRYGAEFADSEEAVRIATRIDESNDVSVNGVLLARTLAFDGQLPAAANLMRTLVERAEANGHIRGLEEKKRLLALYESGEVEEVLLVPSVDVGSGAAVAHRPADLNMQKVVARKPELKPAQSKAVIQQPREYTSDEEGWIAKSWDYRRGRNALEKDYFKALECLTNAYELNGEKKDHVAMYIASLYQQGGPGLDKDTAVAEKWYLRARDAGSRSALSCCLWLYFSRDERKALDPDKAMEYAEIIQTSNMADGVALWTSAMVYGEVGHFQDAVRAMEKAIVLSEEETRYRVSDVFKQRLRDELEYYKRGALPPIEDKD